MDQFSISQLSRFSGIKPHTIRIWEKRYNALEPDRSSGNVRYYTNHQLRRLLNLVSLLKSGHKISAISGLPDTALNSLVSKTIHKPVTEGLNELYILQLLSAGMNFDQPVFEKTFAHCMLRMGLREMYTGVMLPLLERVGQLWAEDTMPPAQEHFMTNILRQKIITATDALPPAAKAISSWVLFLPEDEFHELGLLMAQFLLQQAGHQVYYLGSSVPVSAVEQITHRVNPQNLLLFLVHQDLPELLFDYLKQLSVRFPDQQIHVAANPERWVDTSSLSNIIWLNNVTDLEKILIC